jgi:hypothetical protein
MFLHWEGRVWAAVFAADEFIQDKLQCTSNDKYPKVEAQNDVNAIIAQGQFVLWSSIQQICSFFRFRVSYSSIHSSQSARHWEVPWAPLCLRNLDVLHRYSLDFGVYMKSSNYDASLRPWIRMTMKSSNYDASLRPWIRMTIKRARSSGLFLHSLWFVENGEVCLYTVMWYTIMVPLHVIEIGKAISM